MQLECDRRSWYFIGEWVDRWLLSNRVEILEIAWVVILGSDFGGHQAVESEKMSNIQTKVMKKLCKTFA